MASTDVRKRRQLTFNSLDEILQDAARWEAEQYEPIGNWSCGQILRHLAITMNGAIDGFGFRASWMIRVVARLMKQSVITKSMRPGFQLPKRAKSLLPADNVSTAQGLAELKAALARYS